MTYEPTPDVFIVRIDHETGMWTVVDTMTNDPVAFYGEFHEAVEECDRLNSI